MGFGPPEMRGARHKERPAFIFLEVEQAGARFCVSVAKLLAGKLNLRILQFR
jgi:hypothetical protein